MPRKKQYRYDNLGGLSNVLEIPEIWLKQDPESFAKACLELQEILKKSEKVVLEVGCGSGEYTLGLSELMPEIMHIGIDLKGDRLWTGANRAFEKGLRNTYFCRMDLGQLDLIFPEKSVDEIWITFPDPQPNNSKKRLTGFNMLNKYLQIIRPSGKILLKTDNDIIFQDFLTLLKEMNLIFDSTADLYSSNKFPEFTRKIKTHYEKKYLALGQKIKMVQIIT